ncbi:MAG: 16S rRNA (cytosine(1402)-N(4))-methyltransferase RsmH [Actinomycetota bacterium]
MKEGITNQNSKIMYDTQSLLGSLPGNKMRASTPPACYLVRSGRNPDVRLLSGRLPKSEGKAETMTLSKKTNSITNGSPLDPAASVSDRRITRFSDMPFMHKPVMENEVVELFSTVPSGVIVDATLGGAGHSLSILKSRPDIHIVGIDQDTDAIRAAKENLEAFERRITLIHNRFDNLAQILEQLSITKISGAMFDLGVSSYQLDNPERGFSFRKNGPLDMRMNVHSGKTAHDLVNKENENILGKILKEYGDERFHRRVAKAIVNARPISDTDELAEIISLAIPAHSRRSGGHPARRSFQAIRIAVNQELAVIEPAIIQTIQSLKIGGRCGVLSYHSGEDRIVKQTIREYAGLKRQNSRYLPEIDDEPEIKLLSRKSKQPSEQELKINPRASSARFRTFEKAREGDNG